MWGVVDPDVVVVAQVCCCDLFCGKVEDKL